MKPLLPTLKEKKRYMVYELISETPVPATAEEELLTHLRTTLGLFDAARAGILPVKYIPAKQVGILRVAHTSVDKVKAALLLLTTIKKQPVIPRVLGVSGILKQTARFVPEKRTKLPILTA